MGIIVLFTTVEKGAFDAFVMQSSAILIVFGIGLDGKSKILNSAPGIYAIIRHRRNCSGNIYEFTTGLCVHEKPAAK
jgi:hypothetical protein